MSPRATVRSRPSSRSRSSWAAVNTGNGGPVDGSVIASCRNARGARQARGRLLDRVEWQEHRERGAFAFDGRDLDTSMHRVDAVVDDRQAQADAVDAEPRAVMRARGATEDRPQ